MASIPVLLVTANVGSIFEDPTEMLKIWTMEFVTTIARLQPKFIALHCQEVGGKNYENSMKHVEDFVKLLRSSGELKLFDRVRIFLDEDYSSAENFTALGNLYFVHESVADVLVWDFAESKFTPVPRGSSEISCGNIEDVATKEKAKFPQDFFPECKWSRKGFMRTRWSLNGTVVDLVNIHLFHDASNLVAMEAYPSVYCKNRRRALEHTLQRFHSDKYGRAPYFVFGDFNFRTDTDGVIRKLTEGLNTVRLQNNKHNEHTKLQFANDDSELVLTVGKKEFNHLDHQNVFLTPSSTWLRPFDLEVEAFDKYLTEFPITFPPSYPFEEKISHAKSYMQTRCPAWCDRVLLSHAAKQLIKTDGRTAEYGIMGLDTCMGDHKPVFLRADLLPDSGTLECCAHDARDVPACACCQSYASWPVTINVVDMSDLAHRHPQRPKSRSSFRPIDSSLLHCEPIITRDMLAHEPYTPESTESHSPLPDGDSVVAAKRERIPPGQLKSRLESILLRDAENGRRPMTRSVSENVDLVGCARVGDFYRGRAMSEVTKVARLISMPGSLIRLQSHHSSSNEDWFEFGEGGEEERKIEIASDDDDEEDDKSGVVDESSGGRRDKAISCCGIV